MGYRSLFGEIESWGGSEREENDCVYTCGRKEDDIKTLL
jgi:hypothetical protein